MDSLQFSRSLGARVHIFVLGRHLGFGNYAGLGRGKICRGSRCEAEKMGEERVTHETGPTGGEWYKKINGKFPENKFWDEISGKKCLRIWVYLARLSSFPKILENVNPLAVEKLRNFKPKCLVEWKVHIP